MTISENYLEKLGLNCLYDTPSDYEEPTWEDGVTLIEYMASFPVRFASECPEYKGVYE